MNSNTRYDGKPMLKLLELYVLNAIGELTFDDAVRMKDMTPILRTVYDQPGEWPEILATVVGLSSDSPAEIKELWDKNRKIAEENDETLLPQAFAEMIVDHNFDGI